MAEKSSSEGHVCFVVSIAELTNVNDAQEQHGADVETTRAYLLYFAEKTRNENKVPEWVET